MWLIAIVSSEFLITLTNALQWQDCQKIECGATGSNVCTDYSDNILKIGSCDSGYTCPNEAKDLFMTEDSEYASYDCVPIETTCGINLGAGQSCCENSGCASGTCENGKCVGKDVGSDCKFSEECQAGYWCDNGICVEISGSLGDICKIDDECPVGSGCNLGVCTKLVSLDVGQASGHYKFCKSGLLFGEQCDEIIIKVDEVQVESPFPCNIGQLCQYYLSGSGYMIYDYHCPCNGNEGETQSHCYFYAQVRKEGNFVYESLQYDASICSGQVTHMLDYRLTRQECGHYTEQQIEEWKQEVHNLILWPLYQSGAIDGCAENLGLFNIAQIIDPDKGSDSEDNVEAELQEDLDEIWNKYQEEGLAADSEEDSDFDQDLADEFDENSEEDQADDLEDDLDENSIDDNDADSQDDPDASSDGDSETGSDSNDDSEKESDSWYDSWSGGNERYAIGLVVSVLLA